MIGTFLVQKRFALIGDGIGHVAFAGVGAGLLVGVWPVWTALLFAVVGALGVEWLREHRRASGDVALALLFYSGIAIGVVLASAANGLDASILVFLFGSRSPSRRGRSRRSRPSVWRSSPSSSSCGSPLRGGDRRGLVARGGAAVGGPQRAPHGGGRVRCRRRDADRRRPAGRCTHGPAGGQRTAPRSVVPRNPQLVRQRSVLSRSSWG